MFLTYTANRNWIAKWWFLNSSVGKLNTQSDWLVLTSEDFTLWKRDLHLIITRAELRALTSTRTWLQIKTNQFPKL